MLEIFNDEFRAAPSRPTASDAKRSLLWLEEQMRDVQSLKTGVTHGRSRRYSLFDPPPAPQLEGWSFIEFAVDVPTGARLAAYIRSLRVCHGARDLRPRACYRARRSVRVYPSSGSSRTRRAFDSGDPRAGRRAMEIAFLEDRDLL
jgi:hypothetical protein